MRCSLSLVYFSVPQRGKLVILKQGCFTKLKHKQLPKVVVLRSRCEQSQRLIFYHIDSSLTPFSERLIDDAFLSSPSKLNTPLLY
jgi:hypothetical protein